MDWWHGFTGMLSSGWNALVGVGERDVVQPIGAAFHLVQQAGSAVIGFMTRSFTNLTGVLAGNIATITGDVGAIINALSRVGNWIQVHQTGPLRAWVSGQLARLWAAIFRLRAWAHQQDVAYYYEGKVYTFTEVMAERKARIQAINKADAYTRAHITAMHQLIEREAASGYATGYNARVTLLQKILDAAAGRDPLVKAVTGRLVSIILDLAGAEDPVLRWVAGHLLAKVAADLGVDKAIGDLAAELAGPLLGQPHPKSLHDVVADITARLNTLESQWAQFMDDGGPQILQAGSEWKSITSVLADVGLLGFAAAAVTDPQGTAAGLADVIRPVGTSTISRISEFLAKG